jgi:HSP20 family protein
MGLPVLRRRTDPAEGDPATELERMRTDLWSLLDTPWAPFGSWPARLGASHIALADLEETDAAFTLEVELPGIDTDDIDIQVEGRRVIVTAERKEREREGVLRRRTRVTGYLHHEVQLPADIDEEGVEARLEQGVLHLHLPKSEPAKRHHIEIQ